MAFPTTRTKRLTGAVADVLSPYEQVACIVLAEAYGIPATILAAIRCHEAGRPGREFGILSPPVDERDEYAEQAHLCAQTVANNVVRFQKQTGRAAWTGDRLSDTFIAFLGSRYAPVGAENDTQGLNQHWIGRVTELYRGSGLEIVPDPARGE